MENDMHLKFHEFETRRVDEKFKESDVKYQIQFTAAEKAIAIASTAQEKLVAQALDGTKEAINKADIATDKRFELLSEKITEVSDKLSVNAGAQGIYVTHEALSTEMEKLRNQFEVMLRPVVNFMNSTQGGKQQVNSVWGYVVGAISLGITITLFALKFMGN